MSYVSTETIASLGISVIPIKTYVTVQSGSLLRINECKYEYKFNYIKRKLFFSSKYGPVANEFDLTFVGHPTGVPRKPYICR